MNNKTKNSNRKKQNIERRVIFLAEYMLKTEKTVREIGKELYLSKSTVHRDLAIRLKKINYNLFKQVKKILDYHFSIKHINGGQATKLLYQ